MKKESKTEIESKINQFISLTNNFELDAVIALFAHNASIDDESVGEKFTNTAGIRRYLENYFVHYKTVTKLESLNIINNSYAEVRVDFTGNFGHETGGLHVKINEKGLIISIHAYLD